jgi:hypothetical protein
MLLLSYFLLALQVLAVIAWTACFVAAFRRMFRGSRLATLACIVAILGAGACGFITVYNLDPRGGFFTHGVDMVGLNGAAILPLFAGLVCALIASEVPFVWCRQQADSQCRAFWYRGQLLFFSNFAIAMIHALCLLTWLYFSL